MTPVPLSKLRVYFPEDLCPKCEGHCEETFLASPPDPQSEVTVPCDRCGGSGLRDEQVAA